MSHEPCTGGLAVHLNKTSEPRKARQLLVLPVAPWPVRRNGVSLRYAPIVDYLARHATNWISWYLRTRMKPCHRRANSSSAIRWLS